MTDELDPCRRWRNPILSAIIVVLCFAIPVKTNLVDCETTMLRMMAHS